MVVLEFHRQERRHRFQWVLEHLQWVPVRVRHQWELGQHRSGKAKALRHLSGHKDSQLVEWQCHWLGEQSRRLVVGEERHHLDRSEDQWVGQSDQWEDQSVGRLVDQWEAQLGDRLDQ
jgi:hypothetical protein